MKILFICTGNTCRSPIAEFLARSIFVEEGLDIEFSSAGVAALGDSISENSRKTLEKYGIDASNHISKQVDSTLVKKSDLIFTMTGKHKNYLISRYEGIEHKIFTLKEYIAEQGDIPDPFAQELELYYDCAEIIKTLLEKVVEKIKNDSTWK